MFLLYQIHDKKKYNITFHNVKTTFHAGGTF